MSKKISTTSSGPKPNVTSSGQPYNPSAIRWQSTYLPPMGHQLALPHSTPNPGLWTPIGAPITAGYGYGFPFPRYGPPPPPPVGPHTNYCCLSNHRHQCGATYDHNCNGWPTPSPNWPNIKDDEINGVAITEVTEDSKNGSEDELTEVNKNEEKSVKGIKELLEINNNLKTNLKETKQQLSETKELLLQTNEKMIFECLEHFRRNLKKYGDFIRLEVNRFYKNEEMAQKLKPIVEQISSASQHIKEVKEKYRQSFLTTRQQLKEDKMPDMSANVFNAQSLPDFPDLLTFYKNILDEIPLIFLSDLKQLKLMANDFLKSDKLSNNGLTITSPFGDEPTPSLKPLFSAPKISDLPKPDFNTLPLKPSMTEITETPALELNFPRSVSPIPIFSNSIIDEPITSTPLLDINLCNAIRDKPISPIGKPVQPVIDLKAICAETVKNNIQKPSTAIGDNSTSKLIESKLETDYIRAPSNPIPRFAKPKSTTILNKSPTPPTPPPQNMFVETIKPSTPPLNQAQSKLLVKLKEKYPQMDDHNLIESMSQTKAVLIASGNPKGFSGMKVADIINKISEYIDNKTKPRLIDMSSNIKAIDKMGGLSSDPPSKKGWNLLNNKSGKSDDSICSICFESIPVNARYDTECRHFFHNACISNWIKTDGSCPICRSLVLSPGDFPEL